MTLMITFECHPERRATLAPRCARRRASAGEDLGNLCEMLRPFGTQHDNKGSLFRVRLALADIFKVMRKLRLFINQGRVAPQRMAEIIVGHEDAA